MLLHVASPPPPPICQIMNYTFGGFTAAADMTGTEGASVSAAAE